MCTQQKLATLRSICMIILITLGTSMTVNTVQAVTAMHGAVTVPALKVIDPGSSRYVTNSAVLTHIMSNDLYYKAEGPTNVIAGHANYWWPAGSTNPPASAVDALLGLNLDGLNNVAPCEVQFETTVTTNFDGGFFFIAWSSGDDVLIKPLDADGNEIGTWSLFINTYNTADWDDCFEPHAMGVQYYRNDGGATNNYPYHGIMFKLSEFTNGVGTLTDVKGLRFEDPADDFDLTMVGIYHGPGLNRGGNAFRMTSATFTPTYTNASGYITNDFDVTGISCRISSSDILTGPSGVYKMANGTVAYPISGTPPVNETNSLVGLGINGVSGARRWDFMFAGPVTNAGDGFFCIEQISSTDSAIFYPLDANRNPISGYSVYAVSGSDQWGSGLAPHLISWQWPGLTSLYGNIGGIVIPLYAFTGGTGKLEGEVYGVRMYDLHNSIDPMVVGTYHATWGGMLGAEFNPPPVASISANASYNHRYTNAFNLTAIILPNGRYTDIEGPASVISSASYWVTPATPVPSSGANAMTGLVATAAAINIGSGNKLMFTTPLTSDDDGGFFVVDMSTGDNGDDFTAYPLDNTGTRISTWSLSFTAGTFGGLLNTIEGFWYDVRDLTGVSFELGTFTGGTPPLTDVYGIELSSSGLDPALVGIYRGPTVARVTGSARPITDITFNPAPGGNPVSNDFAVAGVTAAGITSLFGISGASTVNLHGYYSGTGTIIYPNNGTSPGTGYAGRTNSLTGLAISGLSANIESDIHAEFMFPKPVIYDTDGFFVIEMGAGKEDSITILPLDENRVPISTYSIKVGEDGWGRALVGTLVDWAVLTADYDIDGIMMTLSDFAGGTGKLAGRVYGIRIEDPSGNLDPLVVGTFKATPNPGTAILIR